MMVPALLVAAGVGVLGYKVWYDGLPLAKKIRVGDQVKVPASAGMSGMDGLPQNLNAYAILKVVTRTDDNLSCTLEEIVLSADNKLLDIPAKLRGSLVNVSPATVVSAERLDGNTWRTVT